jgi:hypothetical protein
MTKREIKARYEHNLELFESSKAGEEECISYTAKQLNITYNQVCKAIY